MNIALLILCFSEDACGAVCQPPFFEHCFSGFACGVLALECFFSLFYLGFDADFPSSSLTHSLIILHTLTLL